MSIQGMGDALTNIANATSPYKKQRSISLDKLAEKCAEIGVDIHEVIAKALTMEARVAQEVTGMTMREQARLAWQVVDKATPSLQSIKHSGDPDEPMFIKFSKDDEQL